MHVHNITEVPGQPYSASLATAATTNPDEGQDVWVRITPSFIGSSEQFHFDIEAGVMTVVHYVTTTSATILHLYVEQSSPDKAQEVAQTSIAGLIESLNAVENGNWSEI